MDVQTGPSDQSEHSNHGGAGHKGTDHFIFKMYLKFILNIR